MQMLKKDKNVVVMCEEASGLKKNFDLFNFGKKKNALENVSLENKSQENVTTTEEGK